MYCTEASDQSGACSLKHLVLFSKVLVWIFLHEVSWIGQKVSSKFTLHADSCFFFFFFTPVESITQASAESLSLSDGWTWISALWYAASYWSLDALLKKPHWGGGGARNDEEWQTETVITIWGRFSPEEHQSKYSLCGETLDSPWLVWINSFVPHRFWTLELFLSSLIGLFRIQ